MAIHLFTGTYLRLITVFTSVISGFRREVDEKYALLGYYLASSGKFLPTFGDYLSVPYSRAKKRLKTLEDGTDSKSRNVGKKLPVLAA
jgi:hypothetical protein